MESLWVAKTGLEAQQTRLSVISQNLANINTTGFKAGRAIFEDLLGISDVVVENLHDGEARLRLRCCCTPNTRI